MERATGERSLKQMVLSGEEEEANRTICSVVEQLHAHVCYGLADLVPLPVWFRSLETAAGREGGFFARGLCGRLVNSWPPGVIAVALHGDIHYGNILDGGPRGWLAIDPKGLVGGKGVRLCKYFLQSRSNGCGIAGTAVRAGTADSGVGANRCAAAACAGLSHGRR